ncbi:hypothetical protein APHAL10511_006687 [Amanita phalloides]|nr:hypothetical protein APHAL10511_006687 [Amanita phalloides]
MSHYSPHHIPADIVQGIFAVFSTTLSTEDPKSFPWFLGHICSRWRSIFRSMTVDIWSKISIMYNADSGSRRHYKDLVRFFLDRDPAAPISFDFILLACNSKFSAQEAYDMRLILEMLIDESMRWRSILVSGFRPSALLPLAHARNRLPLLREAHIPFPGVKAFGPLHDIFQTAPSLNVIHLYDAANWKFIWSNLTEVHIARFELGSHDFIAALPQMIKLERLNITCPLKDYTPPKITVLSKLVKLECHYTWFPLLNTPALVDLTILNDSINPSDILRAFLHTSSCDILRLRIISARTMAALDIIRLLPRIVHLELFDVFADCALYDLTISTEPGCEQLARHITSFGIYSNPDPSEDPSLLLDFISSRTGTEADNAGCAKLQRLDIGGLLSKTSHWVVESITELCKEREVQCWLEEWSRPERNRE